MPGREIEQICAAAGVRSDNSDSNRAATKKSSAGPPLLFSSLIWKGGRVGQRIPAAPLPILSQDTAIPLMLRGKVRDDDGRVMDKIYASNIAYKDDIRYRQLRSSAKLQRPFSQSNTRNIPKQPTRQPSPPLSSTSNRCEHRLPDNCDTPISRAIATTRLFDHLCKLAPSSPLHREATLHPLRESRPPWRIATTDMASDTAPTTDGMIGVGGCCLALSSLSHFSHSSCSRK